MIKKIFRQFFSSIDKWQTYILNIKLSILTIILLFYSAASLFKSSFIEWGATLICFLVCVAICLTQLILMCFGRKEDVKFMELFLRSYKEILVMWKVERPEIYLKEKFVNPFRLCVLMQVLWCCLFLICFIVENIKWTA